MVDLSKDEEENPSLQQTLRRNRKGVAQAASIPTLDTEDLIGKNAKPNGKKGRYVKAGELTR